VAIPLERARGASGQRLALAVKLQLAVEIVVSYAQVRKAMRRSRLPEAVEALRRPRHRARLAAGEPDAAALGRAVERTLSALPGDVLCLARSLVLLRVLARRGIDGTLVIAVLPGGQQELSAHAWVELDGRPLLAAAAPGYRRLLTL
jgi:hypothetical protein